MNAPAAPRDPADVRPRARVSGPRQLAGAQPVPLAPRTVSEAPHWAANDRLQPPARRAPAAPLLPGPAASLLPAPAASSVPALAPMPPLARTPLAAKPWGPLSPWAQLRGDDAAQPTAFEQPEDAPVIAADAAALDRTRVRRRTALLALMFGPAAAATWAMATLLPHGGAQPFEALLLGLFALLFCWVSAGFWTAVMGFVSLVRGDDAHLVSRLVAKAARGPIPAAARTAIVMPICNEDVGRVFAGLRATWESLAATGELEHFDVYVLSDSSDPDLCVQELAAWRAMAQEVDGFGRLFYRRRERRVKKKSGNIDDFLRRWGANYRYMVVLDADSVMTGSCLTTLVRMMEARPDAGIIQTAPKAGGRDTLFARMQQFASHLYGPLFTAGLHYWQLDESHYWGHNAIIRVRPFMRHCLLAPLPGDGSLSGPIMSHDFVEAALMRRAGWGVWIAHDLPGSYEELPPNLLEELGRDRRWCHGNLMNFRLLFARGIRPVHRAMFFTGAMAYASGPLWLAFLVLSSLLLALRNDNVPADGLALTWQLSLLTMGMLLLPKVLAVALALVRNPRGFGGAPRLIASSVLEILMSVLLAPVRMVFHSRFVIAALAGWKLEWRSPARDDQSTSWQTAVARHGPHALAALAWLAAIALIDLNAALWTLPVAGALVLAVGVSVWTSRTAVGRAAREAGLFLVPEEIDVPSEMRRMRALARRAERDAEAGAQPGWLHAIVDPQLHALLAGAAPVRRRAANLRAAWRNRHLSRARREGPEALDGLLRRRLLRDRHALIELHQLVWGDRPAHEGWRSARRAHGVPSLAPRTGTFDERLLAAAREHRAELRRDFAIAS